MINEKLNTIFSISVFHHEKGFLEQTVESGFSVNIQLENRFFNLQKQKGSDIFARKGQHLLIVGIREKDTNYWFTYTKFTKI
ncbi:MAG: hypothetical protein IPP60_01235 [Sphingobacteriales bacterium]|nr:hypothetical protein [Sphingobacteriales bacterium]